MKTLLLLCLVALALARPEGDTYDPKYDNFNVQQLVENARLLEAYGKCFLDKGPCTSDGLAFKKSFLEILRTNCGKCTPKQRELIRIAFRAFQKDLPDVWQELSHKVDPTGQFKESFEKFLSGTD